MHTVCTVQTIAQKKTVKITKIFSIFQVKAIRNFELAGFLGFWYVVQYYASSEEAPVYGCMRSMFCMEEGNHVSVFYILCTCISFTMHSLW